MMETFDNGVVALSIENNVGTIRFLKEIGSSGYVAVCTFSSISQTIVKISGLLGKLSKQHMLLLVSVLFDKGYRVAYAERLNGRKLPFAEKIEGGDFDQWLRVDFNAVLKAINKGEAQGDQHGYLE